MEIYTECLIVCSERIVQLLPLTNHAEEIVKKSRIKEGFLIICTLDTTSGIIVHDNEIGCHQDLERLMERLTPKLEKYNHDYTGEHNGAAHLRSVMTGHDVLIPVTKSRMDLGPRQQILFAEYDGRQDKKVIFKVIGI